MQIPFEETLTAEIDTPALILNLDVAKTNLGRMMGYLNNKHVSLRPHVKLYRATPQLVNMQLHAGAKGVTCAKVSEAEVLVASGINDILIANEIIGAGKVKRLIELARKSHIIVGVDSVENVKELSDAASSQGVELGIMVELNIGHNRCGVQPYEPALQLVQGVLGYPGLRFIGLMGYDGHCTLKVDETDREKLSTEANTLLIETKRYIEAHNIKVETISGSGSFTYRFASNLNGFSEIQAGTFLLMDDTFQDHGIREFDCALSVLTTIISIPVQQQIRNMAIVDVGRKSISPAYGYPRVIGSQDAKILSLSDEHGRLVYSKAESIPKVGSKIQLSVTDSNATINQFDRFYVFDKGKFSDIWRIPICGDHT